MIIFIKLVELKKRKKYTSGFKTKVVLEAIEERETIQELGKKYGRPEIINTDQGSQFTSPLFTEYVLREEISFSMDGKGNLT